MQKNNEMEGKKYKKRDMTSSKSFNALQAFIAKKKN
jgi:hypothetical protein